MRHAEEACRRARKYKGSAEEDDLYTRRRAIRSVLHASVSVDSTGEASASSSRLKARRNIMMRPRLGEMEIYYGERFCSRVMGFACTCAVFLMAYFPLREFSKKHTHTRACDYATCFVGHACVGTYERNRITRVFALSGHFNMLRNCVQDFFNFYRARRNCFFKKWVIICIFPPVCAC